MLTTAYENDKDEARLRDLFRKVMAGDERSFREFYEIVSRPLLAYCLSFARDMDDAKDLFQHTMAAVYENRHKFRDENLMGWVFTIARNACRTWERKRQRFTPLSHEPEADTSRMTFETEETVTVVQQAILQLPDEFRTVILLRYFGEMSVKDIAASEDISESLAKVRLFRARERLHTILGPLIGPEA